MEQLFSYPEAKSGENASETRNFAFSEKKKREDRCELLYLNQKVLKENIVSVLKGALSRGIGRFLV